MKKAICILTAIFTLAFATVALAQDNGESGKGCSGGACEWRR